jgi:hypothetical protein
VPDVSVEYFQQFTGFALTDDEVTRLLVLLDRARRTIDFEILVPDVLTGDDLADYNDAVAELAHFYWESEKSAVMEINVMPLSQLSLSGLFWTKGSNYGRLDAVDKVIGRWGSRKTMKIVLEGELNYTE